MARAYSTVIFLSRATRAVAGFCLFVWIVAVGIAVFSDPNFNSNPGPEFMAAFWPATILYFIPGSILFISGALVRTGRLWAAVIVLLISILSLFKLAFLLLPYTGPYFAPPLGCELPVRLLSAVLSVGCAYAWEDLTEMNRTRSRRPRGTPRIIQTPPPPKPPQPAPPKFKTPPPHTKIPRPKLQREKPPQSRTTWS
jgi:hypothetical protein